VATLAAHGIHVPPGVPPLFLRVHSFELDEDDPLYARLQPLLAAWGALDWVGTRFSQDDLARGRTFQTLPRSQAGYPEPDPGNFGYQRETYDGQSCGTCGAGMRQIAPFRLKGGEPNWGRRQVFLLHWVLDEIFARRETHERVLRPLGVGSRPVLPARGAEPLQTVVQLVIPESRFPLALDGHASETCVACGQRKYLPIVRGFFPDFVGHDSAPLVKSQEWWGSGAQASRWIIANRHARDTLVAAGVNMSYVPSSPQGA
jgi:hypothetical protein